MEGRFPAEWDIVLFVKAKKMLSLLMVLSLIVER